MRQNDQRRQINKHVFFFLEVRGKGGVGVVGIVFTLN